MGSARHVFRAAVNKWLEKSQTSHSTTRRIGGGSGGDSSSSKKEKQWPHWAIAETLAAHTANARAMVVGTTGAARHYH
jgi:hypothetical protein